jgi:hypothetical protein
LSFAETKNGLTNFSFSSSISSLAAMQFRVSRKVLLCACSIRLCTNTPTMFTATNTSVLALSWNETVPFF